MQTETFVTTTTTRTITLSGNDIAALLGVETGRDTRVEVTFTVPSGGDYSGDDIEIDVDHPITVTIVTTKEETK